MKITCDVCGGELVIGAGGKTADCTVCGMAHSMERVREKLKEYDIEMVDDEVILSRKITSGKAVARINGEAVPAVVLKEISSLLIDIHGQHEHQSLLSKKRHLDILDGYAKNEL